MSSHPSSEERLAHYLRIIKRFLKRLSRDQPRIHVPAQTGLRKPHPGMLFHLTPELFLQEEGSTEFTCPSGPFHLKKEQLALMPRGMPHGERAWHGKKSFQSVVVCVHGTQLSLIVGQKTEESEIPEVAFSDHFEGPEVSAAIRYLDNASAIPKNSPTAELQLRALIFACLATVQDLLLSSRTAKLDTAPHPKVARCRELIHAYLNNPDLSALDLSRQMGCTADHLSRCFRREMGMPLFEYLRQQRLKRACALLHHPNLNISEIAWACGFNSLNYFVRSFRQILGKSPGQYRRSLVAGAVPGEGEESALLPAQTLARIRSRTSSGRSAFKTGRPKTT